MKSIVKNWNCVRSARGIVASGLLLITLATRLAGETYLDRNIDGLTLLPPPPAVNPAEQAADLATVRAVYNARTDEEFRAAEKRANLSPYNFAPVIGDFFKPGKFPKVDALLEGVKTNASASINITKDHWNRLRPYQVDPSMKVTKPERSTSYPSGHSTRGTIQSFVLAEIFPENRDAILAMGRQIGWDRVILAKHFPSDVFAGRVLGQAIMREMKKNPAYQRDLAAAKAEIEAFKAPQQHAETVGK